MPVLDAREERLVAEFELAAQKMNSAREFNSNSWVYKEYVEAKERLGDYRWMKKMHRQVWILGIYSAVLTFIVAILTLVILHKLG